MITHDLSSMATLPTDTKVLTGTGWKDINTLKCGDAVITGIFNDAKILLREEPIQYTFSGYNKIVTMSKILHATAKHKVLVFDTKNNITRSCAVLSSNAKDYQVYTCGSFLNDRNFGKIALNNNSIELMIAYNEMGTHRNNSYNIYCDTEHLDKINRIRLLLKERYIRYYTETTTENITCFSIVDNDHTEVILRGIKNHLNHVSSSMHSYSYNLMNLSKDQVEHFTHSLSFYSGTLGTINTYFSIPENIDVVQAICAINNVSTRNELDHKLIFSNFNTRNLSADFDNESMTIMDNVYGIYTSNPHIIIKQNGCVMITNGMSYSPKILK